MVPSNGAVGGDEKPASGLARDASTLRQRISLAARAAGSGRRPRAGVPPVGAPVASGLTQPLHEMWERADLLGFSIAPRRPVVGMRTAKKVLRRLQAQTFIRQSEFNFATIRGFQTVRAQTAALTGAEVRIADLEKRLALMRSEITTLRECVDQQNIVSEAASTSQLPSVLDHLGLPGRFRGDEAQVTEAQRPYVGYFAGRQDVVDIGCGRGEFLRLLRAAKITARGVDTDLDTVKLCRAHGLDVTHGDGLSFLEKLPEDSLGGVFAAQVIEHLAPAQIVSLMQAARLRLRSGGVLVLETVNPACLVALSDFYLDFTHVKPIHPFALQCLAESLEFVDSEILYLSPVRGGPRLQKLPEGAVAPEAAKRFDDAVVATNEVLYGPRDYALIVRRP